MAEPTPLDLDACAREPIRIPGSIQPHGALLVLEPNRPVVHGASENAVAYLELEKDPVGRPLAEALGPASAPIADEIERWTRSGENLLLRTLAFGRRTMNVLGHLGQQARLLEFEEAPGEEAESLESLYPKVQAFVEAVQAASDVVALAEIAAEHLRALTGFDRSLVYRFDESWNGLVLAESRGGALPSYSGLRFPASDIPAQARDLYRLNRLRLIPDAGYAPTVVRPSQGPDGEPLDLSFAQLRSVSPVHLEYMRNMGTLASMSISVVVDGRLWGLISCHHPSPRRVAAPIRAACDLMGQILAIEIGAKHRLDTAAQRLALRPIETELLTHLAQADGLGEGLASAPKLWMALTKASGAAVLADGAVLTVGTTPSADHLDMISRWLDARGSPSLFSTAELSAEMPEAAAFADVASGLLAISISELHPSYVLWFRPEVVRTVEWAGDPAKSVSEDGLRLHPRKSFETWKGQVRNQAEPWTGAEIEAAGDFRTALVEVVMRRAEERAELADELIRANKELEAFSYSVSHDLRAPFRHIVGYAELFQERTPDLDAVSKHYLASIIDAALSAGRLVDDLLHFSQLGRTRLSMAQVDMNKLVAEARRTLGPEAKGRSVEWRIDRLPRVWGDAAMLRQVWVNLLGNALKYSRGRDPAVISISADRADGEIVFTVADNGVGFEMAYVDKLFGVFQRLHRVEEFEGVGIGLALAQRIVHRHGGRIWGEGAVDQGATFRFALPEGPGGG